ncbi:AI-2E family transporter [Paludisphaera mucosa]|uniref:AI-2E family transporter n=1 Tax=Paludisphaera mucosa TaxID=3030827 RepID=A0ABT6FKJ2_9BACT|nr:AI-2E family transporter [Paludisphaera mucosa]MDG3008093.1 AI-2E family transporter [Paludisphaera mucosa]
MNLDVATTRLLRTLLIGGTIIIVMSVAAAVLKPVALAIMVTFLLAPIVARLERYKIPRVASVALVLIVMVAVTGATAYVVGGQFASLAKQLPTYQKNIENKLSMLRPGEESSVDKIMKSISALGDSLASEEAKTDDRIAQPVRIVGGNDLWERVHTYLGPFESVVALGGIVLLLVVFLLFEREDLSNRIIQLVGRGQLGVTTKTLAEIGKSLSSYLTTLALVNAGFGAAIGLGAWAIGLPSPALWGFLAALLRFIPYLGTLLSFSFPFLISIAHYPGWTQPVLVFALFAAAEAVVNSVEPLLYGKSTGISPIGLLVAAMFWAWLWGPLGLLLANAMTVCLAVAGRLIPGLEVLGTLLRHDVSVSDDQRWYQRVLSHDLDGSLTLLDDALKAGSFEEVCDHILIPTLSRAEHDRSRENVDNKDVAFIWRVVRDWLDDVAERDDLVLTLPPTGVQATAAASKVVIDPLPTLGPLATELRPMVGVATGGGADTLVLRMLNLLLRPSGVRLTILTAGGTSLNVTDKIARLDPALVLISHLPPVGLTRARYLTKRMRARAPETPVVFGYWDAKSEMTQVIERLRPASASRVVVSLGAARDLILNRAPAAATPAAPLPSPSTTAAPALVPAGRS